jgi:hypothetical protein
MHDMHREFLVGLDANKTRHSGRTLFDHLKGVHDLLRDWDNEHHVCLAGLYHSIYGTEYFQHQSLKDRSKLVMIIGVRAELLVHYFATKDRPLFETIPGDDVYMTPEQAKDVRTNLIEIEAANLIEQGGNPNTLRKLLRTKLLSNGAKAALSGEVG